MRTVMAFVLALSFLAVVAGSQPLFADPPTMPDVGKWTDSQKIDDILDKLKSLDSMRSEMKSLENSIKELAGLRDKVVMLEDRIKKLESDLNVVLQQVPNNQMNVQEQIRKIKQDIESLRNNPQSPTSEQRLKPNVGDTDLDTRVRTIENTLLQIGGMLAEMRRGVTVPLPTAPSDTNFSPGTRRVYVVNLTGSSQVVLIDGMPFSVEPNTAEKPALFASQNERIVFEAPSTRQPVKELTLKENEYYKFTLR